ncbi:MAG: hypothetical protein AAF495_17130 [Pseudomonadota bacterium]
MWERMFGDLDYLWALLTKPSVESVALALAILVLLQLLWELGRVRRKAQAASKALAGHRVQLFGAAAQSDPSVSHVA